MSRGRLVVLLAIAAAVGVFFAAGWHRYLSLESLKAQQAALQDWFISRNPRPVRDAGALMELLEAAW